MSVEGTSCWQSRQEAASSSAMREGEGERAGERDGAGESEETGGLDGGEEGLVWSWRRGGGSGQSKRVVAAHWIHGRAGFEPQYEQTGGEDGEEAEEEDATDEGVEGEEAVEEGEEPDDEDRRAGVSEIE